MAIVRTRKVIDGAGATAVLAAAEQAATEHGHRVVMAVVDPWGELVELRRTAGAQIASSRVKVVMRSRRRSSCPEPGDGGAGSRPAASERSRCTARPA
jgi:Haem-degrading